MKIVVLNAFACQLGYLGCYGNDWVATPNLDRLAAEGVVFDQHFANTLDVPNLPANARLVRADVAPLDDWADTVAEVLRADADIGWIDGPNLAPPWRMPEDLLAVYCEDEDVEPWPDPPSKGPSDAVERSRLQDTYAAVVTYFDAQLGRLLESLPDDDALLVFTAVHGLALGERERADQGAADLHEEWVHLPLIVRFPQARHAGLRISALTQPLDVPATLAAYLDLEGGPGSSLLPLIRGECDAVRPFAVSRRRGAAAIRTLEWALLKDLDPGPEAARLYVKPDDRWEINDVAQHHPERVETLAKTLREFCGGDG